MTQTYVLVHGAWHTGKELESVSATIRSAGNEAFTPTIKGNGPGHAKTIGLSEAITSIIDYLVEYDLRDIVLVGHSFAGMIITGVADRVGERVHRLVYWNAFVPNNGESVFDMLPSELIEAFRVAAAERDDGGVLVPFPIWREALINDVDLSTAQRTYDVLNPHPLKTLQIRSRLAPTPPE
jgi:pimeloyl-ACP methyl ester carboxylesterase